MSKESLPDLTFCPFDPSSPYSQNDTFKKNCGFSYIDLWASETCPDPEMNYHGIFDMSNLLMLLINSIRYWTGTCHPTYSMFQNQKHSSVSPSCQATKYSACLPCHSPEVLHFFIAGKYQKYQHQQTDDINQRCPLFENSHQRNVFHRSQMTNSLRCPTKWWMLNWKWLISLQTLMLGLKRLQKPLIPY